jgi:hypothetical protein
MHASVRDGQLRPSLFMRRANSIIDRRSDDDEVLNSEWPATETRFFNSRHLKARPREQVMNQDQQIEIRQEVFLRKLMIYQTLKLQVFWG